MEICGNFNGEFVSGWFYLAIRFCPLMELIPLILGILDLNF